MKRRGVLASIAILAFLCVIWISCAIMEYMPIGQKSTAEAAGIAVSSDLIPMEKEETEATGFFTYCERLRVYYFDYHFAEETGSFGLEKTELVLTEEEKKDLLDLLEPYGTRLSTDVLKSDFLKYYCIELDERMTLTIDPECGNYGDNGDSYMFMMEHTPGAFIKGTYIDAELVNFLWQQLEENGK